MNRSLRLLSPRAVTWALALLSPVALAAPLSAQSGTYVDNGLNAAYQVSSEPPWQVHTDHVVCVSNTSPIVGSCGVPGLTVSLTSSTDPGGVMHARTAITAAAVAAPAVTAPPDLRNAFYGAHAGTGFWDRVTFGAFTPAAIRLTYSLDGTVSIAPGGGPTYLSAYGTIGYSATTTPGVPGTFTELFTDGVIGQLSQSRTIQHTGFVDIPLAGAAFLDFLVGINTWSDIGGGLPGTPYSGTSDADFSHTARIGIRAIDASGQDVTAAAGLVFASGATYPASPSATVPEPAAVALFGSGALILAGVTARRRRQRV
jgi:hypothetical protein